MHTVDKTGMGTDLLYATGASMLSLVYTKTDLDNLEPVGVDNTAGSECVTYSSGSLDGIGVGFSHDLGGRASLVPKFGPIPIAPVEMLGFLFEAVSTVAAEVTEAGRSGLPGERNDAGVGLSFSF